MAIRGPKAGTLADIVRGAKNLTEERAKLLEFFNFRSKPTPDIQLEPPAPFLGQQPPVPEAYEDLIGNWMRSFREIPDWQSPGASNQELVGLNRPTELSQVRRPWVRSTPEQPAFNTDTELVEAPLAQNYDFDRLGLTDKLTRLRNTRTENEVDDLHAGLKPAFFNEAGESNPLSVVQSALDALLQYEKPAGMADSFSDASQKQGSDKIWKAKMREESFDRFASTDKDDKTGELQPVNPAAAVSYQDLKLAKDTKTKRQTDADMARRQFLEGPLVASAKHPEGIVDQQMIPGTEELHPTDAILQGYRRGTPILEGDPAFDPKGMTWTTTDKDGNEIKIPVLKAVVEDNPGVYPDARYPAKDRVGPPNLVEKINDSGLKADRDYIPQTREVAGQKIPAEEGDRWYKHRAELFYQQPNIVKNLFDDNARARAQAIELGEEPPPRIMTLMFNVPPRPNPALQGMPPGWTPERAVATAKDPFHVPPGAVNPDKTREPAQLPLFPLQDVALARGLAGAKGAKIQMPMPIRVARMRLLKGIESTRQRLDELTEVYLPRWRDIYAKDPDAFTPAQEASMLKLLNEHEALTKQLPVFRKQLQELDGALEGRGIATTEDIKDYERISSRPPGLQVEPATNTTIPSRFYPKEPIVTVGSDSDAAAASALPVFASNTQGELAAARYPNTLDVEVPKIAGDPNSGLVTRTARPTSAGYDEATYSADVRAKRHPTDDVTREQTSLQLPRTQSQTLVLDPTEINVEELGAQVVRDMPGASIVEQRAELARRVEDAKRELGRDPNNVSRMPPYGDKEARTVQRGLLSSKDAIAMRLEGWHQIPRARQVPTGIPGKFILYYNPTTKGVIINSDIGEPIETTFSKLPPVAYENMKRMHADKRLFRMPTHFKVISSGRDGGVSAMAAQEFRNARIGVAGQAMDRDAERYGLTHMRLPNEGTPLDKALPKGGKLKRSAAHRTRANISEESEGTIIMTDGLTRKGEVVYQKRGYYDPDKNTGKNDREGNPIKGKQVADSPGAASQEVFRESNLHGRSPLAINVFEGTPQSNARKIVNWMLENQVQIPFIEGKRRSHLTNVLPPEVLTHPRNQRRQNLMVPEAQNKTAAEITALRQQQIGEKEKIIRETMQEMAILLKQLEGPGYPAKPKVPAVRATAEPLGRLAPGEKPPPARAPTAEELALEIAPNQPGPPNPSAIELGKPGLQRRLQVENIAPLVDEYQALIARDDAGDVLKAPELQRLKELQGMLQRAGDAGLLGRNVAAPEVPGGRRIVDAPFQRTPRTARETAPDLTPPEMVTAPPRSPLDIVPASPLEQRTLPPEAYPTVGLDPKQMGQKPKIPEARLGDAAFVAAQRADPSLTTEMWQQLKKNRGLAAIMLALGGVERLGQMLPDEPGADPEGSGTQTAGINGAGLAKIFKNLIGAFKEVEPGQKPLSRVTKPTKDVYDELQRQRELPGVEAQDSLWERFRTAVFDQKLPLSAPQRQAIKAGLEVPDHENVEQGLNVVYGGSGSEAGIGRHNLKEAIRKIDDLGMRSELSAYLDATSANRAWETVIKRVTSASHEAQQALAEGRTGDYNRLKKEAQTLQENINKKTVAPLGQTREVAQAKLKSLEKKLTPEQREALSGMSEVMSEENKRILKLYVNEGLISKEVGDELSKREHLYVPLAARDGEYDEATQAFIKARTGRVQALAAKRDKGIALSVAEQKLIDNLLGSGAEKIISKDPLEAWSRYHQEAFTEVSRNRAAKLITSQKDLPSMRWDPKSRTGIKQLRSDEVVPSDMGVLSVMEKGKETRYQVPAAFAEAAKFMDQKDVPPLMALLGKTRGLMQAMATSGNFAFALRNVPRDLMGAAMLTPGIDGKDDMAKLGMLYARNLKELSSEFRPDILGGPLNPMKFEKGGSKNRAAYYESQADLSTMSQNINAGDEYTGSLRADSSRNPFSKVLVKSQRALNATEQATKESVFEILIDKYRQDKTLTEAQARRKAAIYTRQFGGSPDFARMGSMSAHARDLVMFFNPQVQGLERMVRSYKEHPERAAWQAASFAAGLGALEKWNRSERDKNGRRLYEDVPKHDRDSGIVIMTGGTRTNKEGQEVPNYVKIPLAHEARPFVIPIQAAYAKMYGDQEVDPITTASDVASTILPGNLKLDPRNLGATGRSIVGSLNPILKTSIEQLGNVNSMTGAPIVGSREEKKLPYLQGSEGVSPTARAAGLAAHKIGLGNYASPPRLEHAFRSFFPGPGEVALDTADLFTRGSMNKERSEFGINQVPFANQLARTFRASDSSQLRKDAADPFYEAASYAERVVASVKDKALDKNEPEAKWAEVANKNFILLKKNIAKLNEERDEIQSQPPTPKGQARLKEIAVTELQLLQKGASIAAQRP